MCDKRSAEALRESVANRGILKKWETKLWPGVIFYRYESSFSQEDKDMIRKAMDAWESTGARIVFRDLNENCAGYKPDSPILSIFRKEPPPEHNALGWASVGVVKGGSRVTFNARQTLYYDTALHELGHVLGLEHEQHHPYREAGLRVKYQNCDTDPFMYEPFQVTAGPYDPNSIMHYGACAKTKKALLDANNGKCSDEIACWVNRRDGKWTSVAQYALHPDYIVTNSDAQTVRLLYP